MKTGPEVGRPQQVSTYFTALGTTIEQAWRRADYDEDRFADVAWGVLAADPPAAQLTWSDLVDWLATTATLPHQTSLDQAFGQPPLTLFWNGRFQIEALFWHTGTTAIHQHAFSGVFAVLGGSSVHCRYEFETHRKVSSRFAIGRARLRDVELLEVGAMRRIARGGGLIHSLFHLDTPSVTVVVRTCSDPEAGPELVYYTPTVALDPSRIDALQAKRLQILELLLRIGSEDLERTTVEVLSRADLHTTFLVLVKLASTLQTQGVYERMLERARQLHGEVVEAFVPAIEEERRRVRIVELRRRILDPTHRFFLALLLNLPDRDSIDQLIRSRFPGAETAELAQRWILEMAEAGGLGLSFDAALERLLAACLRGQTVEEIVAELAGEYPPQQIEAQVETLREACRLICAHPVLQPLFRGGGTGAREVLARG